MNNPIEPKLCSIASALPELQRFDEMCFPAAAFLQDEEVAALRASQGFAILFYVFGELVAAGYAVYPEEVSHILRKYDPEFIPIDHEMYVYSVAVHPNYRMQGISIKLIRTIFEHGFDLSFRTVSWHVVQNGGLSENWRKRYQPFDWYVAKNFREGEPDPDADFMRISLFQGL